MPGRLLPTALVSLTPNAHLTTGAVDWLASGSLTNPAFPTGWASSLSRSSLTPFWSVKTDSSANIIPFTQTGDWCAWGIMDNQYGGNLGAAATLSK